MRTTTLVIGMILLTYGAQGTVRQLVDHDNAGLLGWLPGGFGAQLAGHIVLVVAGLLLAGWGGRRPSH
jgi:hypothetical protein